MIIVDASCLVDVLLAQPAATLLMERLLGGEDQLGAPHLIDVEVTQAVRRRWLIGELTADHAEDVFELFDLFPIVRYPHAPLLPRVWELRENLTAYDATYVALAELFEAPLVTRDARLARSRGHFAQIELIE